MLSSDASLAVDLSSAWAQLGAGSLASVHLSVLVKVLLNAVLATCRTSQKIDQMHAQVLATIWSIKLCPHACQAVN